MRVADGGFDLAAIADDPRITHQPLYIGLRERGDRIRHEIVEDLAEALALVQDGRPTQPALEDLQAESLEQSALVAHRYAPFGVVVLQVHRAGYRPARSRASVISDDQIHATILPVSCRPQE
ncbi:hypothetical protein SDC9_82973 [bioreactor metagenome]|uniref:Uncharacterized protein n=1 Tax=bioreactor metagenome TaxID=1076179 RepID=A0A644Z6X7_9ZZZZ